MNFAMRLTVSMLIFGMGAAAGGIVLQIFLSGKRSRWPGVGTACSYIFLVCCQTLYGSVLYADTW